MYIDVPRHGVSEQLRRRDFAQLASLLTLDRIVQAASASSLAIVKSPLSLPYLVWLALGVAVMPTVSFSSVLTAVFRVLEDQASFTSSSLGQMRRVSQRQRKKNRSRQSPKKQDPTTPPSEEAFVQARQRVPLEFWQNLLILLAEAFHQEHQARLRFKHFRLLALDGTRISLPYHQPRIQHFGTARNQRKTSCPQARLLMLQFPFTRFPCRYELATLHEAEVRVGQRLLQSLRPDDLVLLDAGFWSFSLFAEVAQKQAYFAIRLKAGLRHLKTIQRYDRHEKLARLCYSGRDKTWKKVGSIHVRLLTYRIPGFRQQTIVTNQLDREAISYDDWTRLGKVDVQGRLLQGLYSRRWEVETTFRELKVTQQMAGAIRSRTPASLHFEIAGHVLLYALTRWLMTNAAVEHHLDPLQLSFKHCLELLLDMRNKLLTASAPWQTELIKRLFKRMTEQLVTIRPCRQFPRRKRSTNHRKLKMAP